MLAQQKGPLHLEVNSESLQHRLISLPMNAREGTLQYQSSFLNQHDVNKSPCTILDRWLSQVSYNWKLMEFVSLNSRVRHYLLFMETDAKFYELLSVHTLFCWHKLGPDRKKALHWSLR